MKRTKILLALALLSASPVIAAEQQVAAQASLEAPATAQMLSLSTALSSAYQHNPDLEAARAELRAIDELYPQANAGFKPKVSSFADYTSSVAHIDGAGRLNNDPKTLSVGLSQNIFAGGSTIAGMSKAENTVKQGRAKLRVIEQSVLLDGVTAYMNLIRDQKILQLNIDNEKVVETHLKASRERFRLGDITKTNVSQAESRLAKATADRIAAEGNLKRSRAAFEKVIGLPPENLDFSTTANLILPATEDEALTLALNNNPGLQLAQFATAAAKDGTRAIEGERMPQVDVTGSLSKIYDPTTVASDEENVRTIGVRATLPLYLGGSTLSRIRQSRQTENQLRMQGMSTERSVRQSVVDAWEAIAASTAECTARTAQIKASKLALDGVQVETDYGSRTTLDLLDAQQEYRDAQVAFTAAETDRVISSYSLLAAVGSLNATALKLGAEVYDPVTHFQKADNKPFNGGGYRFLGDFKRVEPEVK